MARVLIVDDDEQVCAVVSRLLAHEGHDSEVVHTGTEAIGALRDRRFDLLLIDLVMPEKGGVETIIEIRNLANSIPIIVMSGKVSFEEASITRLVTHYGAVASLGKPFSVEELRRAVSRALA